MTRRNLKPFSALAAKNGLKPATFYNHIRRGWCPLKAAMTPVRQYFTEWSPA